MCKEWFAIYNIPPLTNLQESMEVIQLADSIVDKYIDQLTEEGNTTYSRRLILEFGSAMGKAFKSILEGQWQYS